MFWLLLLLTCALVLNWKIVILVTVVLIIINNPIFLLPVAFVALALYFGKESK